MAKKFDIMKDSISIASDKNNYIAVASVIAYKMFVASRIPNAYLSNMSTVIIPAIASGFATNDKSLVEKMFLAGLALGVVPMLTDLIKDIANKETDPAKKAKLQRIVYTLSGGGADRVAGVDIRTQVNGAEVYAEYESPARGFNRAALSSDSGRY